MRRQRVGLPGVCLGLALMTGCWWKKPKAPAPPVISAPPSPAPAPPPTIAPPPKVEAQTEPIPTLPEGVEPAIPAPKPPAKPRRAVRRPPVRGAAPPAAPEPAPAPETPPAEPVLQLAPLLSAEQQASYNAAIDAALQRAEANLARLDPRRLNGSQRANFLRARSFVEQARQARATDLRVARSLAERADLLARDLARNFR